MTVQVWVDGELVGADAPSIRAIDHGVTVGDGAFETCKIVAGEGFAISRHLGRMDRTLAGLGLRPMDHEQVREGIKAVLSAGDPLAFGRLRWTVTGGVGPLGSDRLDSDLTLIVTAGPTPAQAESVAVATVPWVRNERSATAGLKTTSYAENVVALARAKESGASEALFANTRGDLCEGTGSNVLIVTGGEIITPTLGSGCLAGITRELVLEWAAAAGITIVERDVPLSMLDSCDEVILTSSLKDVVPAHRVDGRNLTPGPVAAQLRALWRERQAEGLDP
ncbi:MAG: aminotransferase class IV [Phycicoccus sp.]|nr:aminotransferase class IV [Phycicoccus sp.]